METSLSPAQQRLQGSSTQTPGPPQHPARDCCCMSCWAPGQDPGVATAPAAAPGARCRHRRGCGQDKLPPTSLQLRFNSCRSDSAEGGGGGVGWKYRERLPVEGSPFVPGPGTSHGCPGAEDGLGCSPGSCSFPTLASCNPESPQPFLPPPAVLSPWSFSPAHLLSPSSTPRAKIISQAPVPQHPEGTSRATTGTGRAQAGLGCP